MIILSRAAEAKTLETLNDIGLSPEGWVAVVFHLGEMREEYRSEYQLKIAVNLVHDLLQNHEGGIFACSDGTLAVICRSLTIALINKLVFQLRYLYMDDPLAYHADGAENQAFSTIYDLAAELSAARKFFQNKLSAARSQARGAVKPAQDTRLTPLALAEMERQLETTDISTAVKKQAVCAIGAAGGVRRIMDECYVHMATLKKLLKTEVEFSGRSWLFRHFTRGVDTKLLQLFVSRALPMTEQPISLNLNVETLLSEDFMRFDAALPDARKVSVMFELQPADIFADMAAYGAAREQLQRQGYRICLDGVTAGIMPQLSRASLGADLVKLQWNADGAADLNTPANRSLKKTIAESGANRVILCRCDGREAVEYGAALGISLFQGRYIDRLLNPTSTVEN